MKKKNLTIDDLAIINSIQEQDIIVSVEFLERDNTILWCKEVQLSIEEREMYKNILIDYVYQEYESQEDMIDRIIRETAIQKNNVKYIDLR